VAFYGAQIANAAPPGWLSWHQPVDRISEPRLPLSMGFGNAHDWPWDKRANSVHCRVCQGGSINFTAADSYS
jgi:hypothetical protein